MSTGDTPRALSLDTLLRWLAAHGGRAYLVGGCIRDRLLGRPSHDLDLVVPSGGLALARRVADHFGGDYFPLDTARGTGRAIFATLHGDRLIVDVAEFRGPDLAADLADRDLTVNALAEDLAAPGTLVDLFHGVEDLRSGILRPVGPDSIRNDPIRALRAVRLAAELGFALAPETVRQLRRVGPALAGMPGERIREEVARLLLLPDSAHSLCLMDELGLLTVLFPELEPLRGMPQPAPHHLPGLDHSLETVASLEGLLAALLSGEPDPGTPPWPACLGPLAPRLVSYLAEALGDVRPRLVALKLAALLHDTGKPRHMAEDAGGRLRFLGHEAASRTLAGEAARRLRCTNQELRLVDKVAEHHMRPLLLATGRLGGRSPRQVSARAVYRFFRDTGDAGPAVLLHALADQGATGAPGTRPDARQSLLDLVVRMVGDYFERYTEAVAPRPILDGHDLMAGFGLSPGPLIGELLEAVREAQAAGEVTDRQAALECVRSRLERAISP